MRCLLRGCFGFEFLFLDVIDLEVVWVPLRVEMREREAEALSNCDVDDARMSAPVVPLD